MNRRSTLITIIATAIFALCLPGLAAAQNNDPWWGRDNSQRDRDYRRDNRDYGNYGRYDANSLRDAVRRVKNLSHDFQRDVDRSLDHSRVNGTRREDNINDAVQDFRRAADRLDGRIGNGRDLNRSSSEARELLAQANQIGRTISRARLDSRASSDWSALNQDLRYIADAYGLSYNGANGGYNRNGNYDPNYPDQRNRRNNDDWRRRLPGIFRP